MNDKLPPTVDFDFFYQIISQSARVETQEQVGDIIAIMIVGSQSSHKRLIYLKKSRGNVVKFEQATGIALRLGLMTELLSWYEMHRNWKNGGYFIR